MPIIKPLHETENVIIRLVTLQPGTTYPLQRHDDKHSLSIPLKHLEDDTPYSLLVNYLLHHSPPKQYYSLNNASDTKDESFLQILWARHK